jgi:transposase-like protein
MMTKISYNGYRFPPVIIQQAIWLYARFTLSFRDVEDLLAERGITVSYETVRVPSLRHADVAGCHRRGLTGIECSTHSIYCSST